MAADEISIRPARWPDDIAALSEIDTSFQSDQTYVLRRGGWSFELVEERASPPVMKRYPFDPSDPAETRHWDISLVAELASNAFRPSSVVGFVAAELSTWNRRVAIHHLYVSPNHRRRGIGGRLLDFVEKFAISNGARGLWLETQNVNYPAIQFYLRHGFTLSGFDQSLYDPNDVDPGEIALFFTREIRKQGAL